MFIVNQNRNGSKAIFGERGAKALQRVDEDQLEISGR
jgi:hypothetical protein